MNGGELSVRVTGTEDLRALARAFRGADFRKELQAALLRAGRPLVDAVRASAAANLPKRGGLAGAVAGSDFAVIPRATAREVGVRIVARGVYDTRSSDAGRLQHPTYGHRDRMVVQEIKPGWFSTPMRAAAPAARRELRAAIGAAAKKVGGSR